MDQVYVCGIPEVRMDKTIINNFYAYQNTSPATLYDVYKKPSYYKIRSWEHIEAICREANGRGLKILSAGCQTYSCAFVTETHFFYFNYYRSVCVRI